METTGPPETYKLSEEAATHLSSLVKSAQTKVTAPLKSSAKLIADIYTGRDPSSSSNIIIGEQGIPMQQLINAAETTEWRPPQTTANLFLSRVRQIVSTLTPGVPSFRAKARVSGAARMVDSQNQILRILTDRGDLRAAMRRTAFLGLLSPYFGLKLVVDEDEEVKVDRFQFKSIEAADCGYEPFYRRFTWHSYDMQWGELPKTWRPKSEAGKEAPKPWDIVRVTEVYHEELSLKMENKEESYEGCPMSVFVEVAPGQEPTEQSLVVTKNDSDSIGAYVITETLPKCPLILGNFLDSAPNEDVPSAEVLSWIPLMRMIVQTLVQIEREIRTSNNTVLYDKNAIKPAAMEIIQNAIPGARVYIPVDADDAVRGVNATMRPVEQSSELDKYIAALSTYLRLFDEVTGVSPTDRGMVSGGRRSAQESAAITNASGKRTQDRLEVMAGMWTKIAQVLFAYQRKVLGTTVDIPLRHGVITTLVVPDPRTAVFAFDVDPVELGHLSNSGDMQAQMQWITVLTRTQQAFQTGMPRMIREALRRLGMTMGIEDVDLYLGAPTIEVGPEERYIQFLQTQDPILVFEDDQHDMFMAYYMRMLTNLTNQGADESQIMAVQNAIDLHRAYAAKRGAAINPGQIGDIVPGVGVGAGEVDNNLAAAFAVDGSGSAVPQQTPGASF